MVIVDQGWPLGARRSEALVGGSRPFSWWELRREKKKNNAAHEVTQCSKLLWWLASWNKRRSFHSCSRRVIHSLCSRAATGVTVIPPKWFKLALEEGRKTSNDPEIHFKQLNRACWNMGIMGFHRGSAEADMLVIISRVRHAASLDACKAFLTGLVSPQPRTPAAGL